MSHTKNNMGHYGLPEALPPGEDVLWQGKSQWEQIATRVFHVYKIAVYFLIVAMIQVFFAENREWLAIITNVSVTLIFGTLAIGIFCFFAWLIEENTVYTITNKRVVMSVGVAVSISINIPFSRIHAASIRKNKDGSGDIPLMVEPDQNVSYLLLHPHVRPWHFSHPQPMLRGIENVDVVAEILANALSEATMDTESTTSTVHEVTPEQPAAVRMA